MSRVRLHISMSLDGFVAGPDQSVTDPLGIGGEGLHEWVVKLGVWREAHGLEGGESNASDRVAGALEGVGATVMGRNMFGGGPGEWPEPAWNGWWGEDPPFKHPVFVLTHHKRPSLEMEGGTSFHFISATPQEALALATEQADGRDVRIGGGPTVVRDFLKAGLVDELHVAVVPILLGQGERLWDDLRGLEAGYRVTTEGAESGTAHITFSRRG